MRDFLQIIGGNKLTGHVRVSGAKNSALPLLMATLLTAEECVIDNIPDLDDITVTLRLLRSLGTTAEFEGAKIRLRTPEITSTIAPYGAVKAMRASFWVLGPLLARAGVAQVALPGGDAIGTRPVDLHLKALSQLGAEIRMHHGVVFAHAPGGLRPAKVVLGFPSVGATHQLLMTAALIPGETILDGAAREPGIVDLAELLQAMGAEIEGAGTSTIVIRGRRELGGAQHSIIGDRIEAATYLLAGAMTGGNISIHGLCRSSANGAVDSLLGGLPEFLVAAGCRVEISENIISVAASSRLRAASFASAPYPGIATDIQPLLMAALTVAEGTSVVTETVFENRFGHVAEYRRLGADIVVDGRTAIVNGKSKLSGAPVEVADIRAGAGLVLLGLVAQGVTEIQDIYHLDRGYELLVEKFSALGARLSRIPLHEQRELVVGC